MSGRCFPGSHQAFKNILFSNVFTTGFVKFLTLSVTGFIQVLLTDMHLKIKAIWS